MEPSFKNIAQEDKHPIFFVLGIFFIILGVLALMALDYKSIIFLGRILLVLRVNVRFVFGWSCYWNGFYRLCSN
jgi:hypothetical protein